MTKLIILGGICLILMFGIYVIADSIDEHS